MRLPGKVAPEDLIKRVVSALFLGALVAILCARSASALDGDDDQVSHKLKVSNRPQVALVLGGGGARGAAHVGVLKILEQENIPINCIVGTNVGAVVGGLYSAGISIDALEEMFTKKSLMRSYLTVPLKLRILAVPLLYLPRMVGERTYDGLYRGNKFRNFLNKYVPQSEQDLEDLKIAFAAVALDLVSGKEEAIKAGNLGKALQASSAIPVLRKPVKMDDKLYVDGGVMCNLPVRHAREMGADIVIAVDLDDPQRQAREQDFSAIGSVTQRVITLHLANIDRAQAAEADLLIRPRVADIGLMSSDKQDARHAIEAGERAALDTIEDIRKLLEKFHVSP